MKNTSAALSRAALLLSCLNTFVLLVYLKVHSSPISLPTPTVNHAPLNSATSSSIEENHLSPSPSPSPSPVVMFAYDRIRDDAPDGLSVAEAEIYASNNFGNMMWRFATHELLDPRKTVFEYINSTSEIAKLRTSPAAFLFPVANILWNASDFHEVKQFTGGLLAAVRAIDMPIFLLGIGIQAEFPPGVQASESLDLLGVANSFELAEEQVHFLHEVNSKSPLITARGIMTEAVCRNEEADKTKALGCPSLMLNKNPRLGQEIQNKLFSLGMYADLKIALTLPAKLPPDMMRKALKLCTVLLTRYPNSRIVLQSQGDYGRIQEMHDKFKFSGYDRVLYFYKVAPWLSTVRNFDLAFGFRIHGTMAAIAAGIPAFVVATDYRIMELARTMRIPHTTIFEIMSASEDFDLGKILLSSNFNGDEFDMNRQRVAGEYVTAFQSVGLAVHPGILRLSQV